MKINLCMAALLLNLNAGAQNTTAGNIIEGGKTLVELVRVFKTPKTNLVSQSLPEKKDSCISKNTGDLCIKNSTANNLIVSLYKRSGNGYEPGELTGKISPKSEECWYELKSGVYKFKLEIEEGSQVKLLREGELKLNACTTLFREIRAN